MTERRRWCRVMASMLFGAVATRIAGPTAAADVDTKGERDVTELGRRIDQSARLAKAAHVTSNIVSEWSAKPMKFDAAAPPRPVTAQDVQSLRAKGLGFGEVAIVLALAANQPDATTAKTVDEIVAMRKPGEGWGKLARDLGYANLGSVVRSVRATDNHLVRLVHEKDNDKPRQMEKADKTERPAKPDKPERMEKVERMERPDRPTR